MEALTRRALIAGAGTGAALALPLAAQRMVDLHLPGGPSARPMAPRFPQKGEMIVQRIRPPLFETPFEVFDQGVFTPNDRFFVRWHWADIPASIDAAAYRIAVRGAVRTPLSLSLSELLRAGEHVEVAAVNQCAGNSRGLFEPRVAVAEWANGAMGNALWKGVRLRDVLDKAGIGANAKFVRFGGLDKALVEGAPRFLKSLPIDIARRDDVIVAFAMNGAAMPLLNGYPVRLAVPGWFSTYWVKMLADIEVLTGEDDNFWMAKAYRMPTVPVKLGDKGFPTAPISTMPPRSWITGQTNGATIALRGIAMGGDTGVAKVELLTGGATVAAALGPDQGKYGFRRWSAALPSHTGEVVVRCTNANGVTQPDAQAWNPGGYARNAVERIRLGRA
ncbi:MAG: molybdopterin-dependent oxidoreductase [Sphingomonadaceae bacterium]|nr:molybdopterin-dependent oxidoreductase [Sphingomonadaceae bacterium]